MRLKRRYVAMGTSMCFLEICRQFGQKSSPIEAVVRIHIAVSLRFCVVQCMIIHVFEEHSGSVFPGRQKVEAVCSDRNPGTQFHYTSITRKTVILNLNIMHFARIASLPYLFQTNQLHLLGIVSQQMYLIIEDTVK
jgi:hypothetical protein